MEQEQNLRKYLNDIWQVFKADRIKRLQNLQTRIKIIKNTDVWTQEKDGMLKSISVTLDYFQNVADWLADGKLDDNIIQLKNATTYFDVWAKDENKTKMSTVKHLLSESDKLDGDTRANVALVRGIVNQMKE